MTDRFSNDQRGPWVLALGAALIGGVAIAVEGYRAVRKRRQHNDSPANE